MCSTYDREIKLFKEILRLPIQDTNMSTPIDPSIFVFCQTGAQKPEKDMEEMKEEQTHTEKVGSGGL